MLHCSSPVVARLKSRASSIPGELILKASVWLRPGITPCVKTCASRERAELFSPFSSFDHDGQCCSFLIQRNRDKLSTRKFDVGVFTQPGPTTDIGSQRRGSIGCPFSPLPRRNVLGLRRR